MAYERLALHVGRSNASLCKHIGTRCETVWDARLFGSLEYTVVVTVDLPSSRHGTYRRIKYDYIKRPCTATAAIDTIFSDLRIGRSPWHLIP